MAMSNTKRTVKIKEKDLINVIDGIVKEAVELSKEKWLTEHKKALTDEVALLESKLNS